jgi:hypothetical protein
MVSASELETILARMATMADGKLTPVLAALLPKLLGPNMITSADAGIRSRVLQVRHALARAYSPRSCAAVASGC